MSVEILISTDNIATRGISLNYMVGSLRVIPAGKPITMVGHLSERRSFLVFLIIETFRLLNAIPKVFSLVIST